MAPRILLVVLDGIGDRPWKGATALQAARKPFLDRLVREGVSGLVDPVAPGVKVGSATGHLALLGYDPYQYYTGRGPFEAAGVGIGLRPGDIAFRCNFATLRGGLVVDRRAGRIRETRELEEAVNRGVRVSGGVELVFRAGTGHRGALMLRGAGLDPRVSPTDPKREGVPVSSSEPLDPAAASTARALNEFTEQAMAILSEHPVNRRRESEGKNPAGAILSRGAGVVPVIPPFADRYHMRGAAVAATALVAGIGRLCGLEFLSTPGLTGGVDSPLEKKMETVRRALGEYDFVMVNIKGADEASHDGKWEEKVGFIERLDGALDSLPLSPDLVVAVTGDHSSPVAWKDHSGDPVPLVLWGEGVRRDGVQRFDEVSCARGGLGRLRGLDVMPLLLDLAGRSEKYGE
ncbi:MAG: 2,3-bisphosphoglycerate-independent phosphoglycerate mutase [Euryarchaeota archaeon]|nr:2,3-bisphosphoglycerate-independent phosphoglycerate mutase [Euryarchaeota archaeon]